MTGSWHAGPASSSCLGRIRPIPTRNRRHTRVHTEFLHDVERNGVGYMRRSLALAGAAAGAVWLVCELCGLPGSVAVGLWAGVWFVVPAFGWAVGLAPLALLVAIDPTASAWVALVAGAAIAVISAIVRHRYIERVTMRIGVAVYVVSVGLGIAIAGIGGSFVTIVLGAMLCAAMASSNWPGRPPGWSLDPKHSPRDRRHHDPDRVASSAVPGDGDARHRCAAVGAAPQRGPAIVWLLIGGFASSP